MCVARYITDSHSSLGELNALLAEGYGIVDRIELNGIPGIILILKKA